MRTPPNPASRPCTRRAVARLAALALAASAFAPLADAAAQRAGVQRAVIVGFDGGDYATVERMVADGELPNFARLREGTFAPLESTMPSESPTAWASLNTGQNPAKTGVPGFVQRELHGGEPYPAFGHLELRSGDRARPLAEVDGAPIPSWSPRTYAILGAVAAALLVGALLVALRVRVWLALPLVALVAGGGGIGAKRVRSWLPERYPVHANPNRQPGLWDVAAREGLRAVVINPAQAWDQPTAEGVNLLAGLGVPDARGELGEWFVYTANPYEKVTAALDLDARPPREGRSTQTAGRVIRVEDRGGRVESHLLGPRNFWRTGQLEARRAELQAKLSDPDTGYAESQPIVQEIDEIDQELRYPARLSVPLVVERDAGGASVTIGASTQRIAEGAWSDWYEVEYALNPLVSVHAITRVKLIETEPLRLFVSRLDLDPAKPAFWQPVSAPLAFSKALAEACGPFATYGWSTLTMPYKDEQIDEVTLLEDVEFTLRWRERVMLHAFDQGGWDLFMGVFSTTDRVQHMLYALHDPEHPLHDPVAAARRVTFFGEDIALADAIPAIYRQADRVLGEIQRRLAPDDLLVVVSDHGFQSFRWEVDVNQLLAELGFLAIDASLEATRDPLPPRAPDEAKPSQHRAAANLGAGYVDWSRTRAYSLGMGQVYVNLAGRERNGIVPADQQRAVLEELRAALLGAEHPETGEPLVTQVLITGDDRTGEFSSKEADLLIGFARGFGPAWTSRGGGTRMVERPGGGAYLEPLVRPNPQKWSGDHVGMDTRNVLGLLLSNRRLELPAGRHAHLLDVAPTVLAALGVPRPEAMDREPLQLRPDE